VRWIAGSTAASGLAWLVVMSRRPRTLEPIPGKDATDEAARRERLDWLAARTGVDLAAVDLPAPTAAEVRGHVENFVGAISVPLGLAGPLLVLGEHAQGAVVAPLATTEGALVAATTRGAWALSESGGVRVRVHGRHMLRAPLFGFLDGERAARFAAWVPGQRAALDAAVAGSSRHARLVDLRPYVMGRDVHVLLTFTTGDAAGQNMTTLATAACCRHLQDAWSAVDPTPLELCLVEGQMSGDKNLSAMGLVHGRGARVSAECRLPRAVVETVLRITPEKLARAHHAGTAGALQAGVVGYNANVANVLAAMFLATGQDVACVHECALAILTLDAAGGDLYASLVLPSLVVGTVGGGTSLPAQRTGLEILGCAGAGQALKLVEIVAAFCLALELSSYAAMVAGDFAGAHARLGRAPGAGR
jgi:NADP-dependent 3-hydroxy-3-methylglutaryl-CoA reductase